MSSEQTSLPHAPIPRLADTDNRLVLVRHGRTEWAHAGRHTGWTDVPLDEVGEKQADNLGRALEGFRFVRVLSSPLSRARNTAERAGLAIDALDDDLREWDYGGYEGMTSAQIRTTAGADWTMFADGTIPGATPGESIDQVAERTARVLARVRPLLADGDVALFAHGHLLRILAATYLGQPPHFGAQIDLEPASVSTLGVKYSAPTILTWNIAP